MKEQKIPVAAPEAGLYVGTGHDKTSFQMHSDAMKDLTKPRMVYEATKRPYVKEKKSLGYIIRPPHQHGKDT